MRILVACEFSGRVREAFRKLGHDAWSIDLLRSDDDSEYHIIGDIFGATDKVFTFDGGWDMLIAHPPCTYLSLAGNKWFKPEYTLRFPNRHQQREEALNFVQKLMDAPISRICIENPISVISTRIRKPDQIIQPYQFGHKDRKPTCLWLKNLPKLVPTEIVEPNIKTNRNGKTVSVHHDAALSLPADERWKARSITYQGIADAMAEQWGELL